MTRYWSPDERLCERCLAVVVSTDVKCRQCGVPFRVDEPQESLAHRFFVALLATWTIVVPLTLFAEAWLDRSGFVAWLLLGLLGFWTFVLWVTGVLMAAVLCYVTDKR